MQTSVACSSSKCSSEKAKGTLCFFGGYAEKEGDSFKIGVASYPKNPYQPFAESCTWSVNNVKYFSSGDTLINNIIYTKIYKEEHNTPFEFNLSNVQYWGAFRNDTAAKKVYFFVPAGCYYNNMGRCVLSLSMFDCKNTIDISNLPSGIYLVKIKARNVEQVSKIIKL